MIPTQSVIIMTMSTGKGMAAIITEKGTERAMAVITAKATARDMDAAMVKDMAKDMDATRKRKKSRHKLVFLNNEYS